MKGCRKWISACPVLDNQGVKNEGQKWDFFDVCSHTPNRSSGDTKWAPPKT